MNFAPLYAQSEIIVKGLTDGRAILSVDEQLIILRAGQSAQGIKLISADNDIAVLEINGERRSIPLDRSIAKTYQPPENSRIARRGDAYLWRNQQQTSETVNDLLSIKLKNETDNEILLEVEYHYNGDQGEDVYLAATSFLNGKATNYDSNSSSKLARGKHTVELRLSMAADAPVVFRSDALNVAMYWSKDGQRQADIVNQNLPFPKYWKKVRVR